jgi:hypothetical protein
MSVLFSKVEFRNTNNIDVTLTIEAPIGTRISGPQKVGANSTAAINPGVNNCLSVLLAVDDNAHSTTKQTFEMARRGRTSRLPSLWKRTTVSATREMRPCWRGKRAEPGPHLTGATTVSET